MMWAYRVAGGEVAAGGESGDPGRADGWGDVEVEVGEPLELGEPGFVDPAASPPFGTVINLDAEGGGEEPEAGHLRPLRLRGKPCGVEMDAGWPQLMGGHFHRHS